MYTEISQTLTDRDITDLISGEILAIRIADFCSIEARNVIKSRVRDRQQTRYEVAPDIRKIGIAFFETTNPIMLQKYYNHSNQASEIAETIYQGYTDPIEKLVTTLSLVWQSGCEVERIHDREMYAGLIRVIDEGVELRPHQDNTNWDSPDCQRAQSLLTQLSANVYFETPDKGGCLELWDFGIEDQDHYQSIQREGDYALSREAIGEPALSIQPQGGDLIIFNARRIHGVTKVEVGARINASTFIAIRDLNQPLTVFS